MTDDLASLTIGILAIQGSIEEHEACVQKLGVKTRLIRLPLDFEGLDGIILPGGESTAMAIVGEEYGLFPKLQEWVHSKRPVWGTCAGMILLSDHAIKQKEGGQSLVGGLDVHVCRNFFGPQINSTKVDILFPKNIDESNSISLESFPAVFIRAPAILKIGPNVTILAELQAKPHRSAIQDVKRLIGDIDEITGTVNVIVAVQQGNILATAFHPELTPDLRFHKYFLELVKKHKITSS